MFAIRFAILSSLFYALNVSMVPMVYSFGVSAFLFLFFRFGTTFLLSLAVTKSLFSFTDIKEKGLVGWLILLTILFGIQSWLFVEAVKYIPVAIASIVLFTYPLITYLMQSHSKKKNLDFNTILMFLLAIIGMALLSQGSGEIHSLTIGLGLALLSSLSYAAIMHFTPKVTGLRNWDIVKYTTLFPALCFLSLFLYEGRELLSFNQGFLWCFVAGTLFAIGMYFYCTAIKKYGPTRTANVLYCEPIIVLAISSIAYTDNISPIQYVGIALVGIASITIERRQSRQKYIS